MLADVDFTTILPKWMQLTIAFAVFIPAVLLLAKYLWALAKWIDSGVTLLKLLIYELRPNGNGSMKDRIGNILTEVQDIKKIAEGAATAAKGAAEVGQKALGVAELGNRQNTALLKRTRNLESNQKEIKKDLKANQDAQTEINQKFARFVKHEANNDLSDSRLVKDVDEYLKNNPEKPSHPEPTEEQATTEG